jgi:uncharacterized protein YjbI with pentapeptide repeats
MRRKQREAHEDPWALRHSGWLIGAGIASSLVVGGILVGIVPHFVSHNLHGNDRIQAQNSVRDTGLKIAGGIAAAFAGVLTWGRLELSRQEHQLAKQQHANEVSGQLTERFTRAIDQLGSEKLDIRLGGIYALERIARESPEDHGPVMEILTTYLREHSPWPPSRPGQYVEGAALEAIPALAARAADIQAVITIVGRRERAHEGSDASMSLGSLDLRKADLRGAHLERADLQGAHLEKADLQGAHLQGVNLIGAHLQGVNLIGAHLQGVNLIGAHLQGVSLTVAYLEGADLMDAHLQGADLRLAHLRGASLTYAHLQGADLGDVYGLTQYQVKLAFMDETTYLPAGVKRPSAQPGEGEKR